MAIGPETTSVIFRRDLTQTAREFDDSAAASLFVAERMAASFPVMETTGRFPVWTRENFKKRPTANTRREGGGYRSLEHVGEDLGRGRQCEAAAHRVRQIA